MLEKNWIFFKKSNKLSCQQSGIFFIIDFCAHATNNNTRYVQRQSVMNKLIKMKIYFFGLDAVFFPLSFHNHRSVYHHRLMGLSSTLPNQSQFELKKYHQICCHERHILETLKMIIYETNENFVPFLRKHRKLATAVIRPLLISAYWSKFIIGGFFCIAIKNISTSFCVDLSTAVKFTFSRRVWNSNPTYFENFDCFQLGLEMKRKCVWNGIQTDVLAYCAILQITNSSVMQYTTIMTRPSSLNVKPWSITSLMPPYNAIIVVKKMIKQ